MSVGSIRLLANILKKISSDEYSAKIANNIADTMSGKKALVKTRSDFFKYLKNNDVLDIEIDAPKGSLKGFGGKKRPVPFDYGEVKGAINPSDNMGWDVIFPPSEETDVKQLVPIGFVEINPDKSVWREMGGKLPPIGNDKIIVSGVGSISADDKDIISSFFNDMWQFKEIVWL